MKKLKKDLKNNKFESIYLFFGEEEYLKKYYTEKFKNKITNSELNLNIFQGKNIDFENVLKAVETLPFMSENKMVLIKNSQIFKRGKKEEVEKIYNLNVPENVIMIFVERNVDKRNKLYKKIKKDGYTVEFKRQKEDKLISWVKNIFKKNDKEISTKVAVKFLRYVGTDMQKLDENIKKLVDYKFNSNSVEIKDIEAICTQSIEAKIFDLVKYIGYKNSIKSIESYNNLIFNNESPLMILSMIARQFRLLMLAKDLKLNGHDYPMIAKKVGIHKFVAKDLYMQCNNFEIGKLKKGLIDILEIDYKIKTGKIKDITGIETFIVKYCN